jgi:tagatose-1,6-bisphosphate aldolase
LIAGLAIDPRGSLKKAIARAKGSEAGTPFPGALCGRAM